MATTTASEGRRNLMGTSDSKTSTGEKLMICTSGSRSGSGGFDPFPEDDDGGNLPTRFPVSRNDDDEGVIFDPVLEDDDGGNPPVNKDDDKDDDSTDLPTKKPKSMKPKKSKAMKPKKPKAMKPKAMKPKKSKAMKPEATKQKKKNPKATSTSTKMMNS